MMDKAILDEHGNVQPIDDAKTWREWFEKSGDKRVVAVTEVPGINRRRRNFFQEPAEYVEEPARVSTVFLGLNHAFWDGPPLWFETMVFGGPLHAEMERYTTIEEARAGHAEMVARCLAVSP